jgi:hypothetical protein
MTFPVTDVDQRHGESKSSILSTAVRYRQGSIPGTDGDFSLLHIVQKSCCFYLRDTWGSSGIKRPGHEADRPQYNTVVTMRGPIPLQPHKYKYIHSFCSLSYGRVPHAVRSSASSFNFQ